MNNVLATKVAAADSAAFSALEARLLNLIRRHSLFWFAAIFTVVSVTVSLGLSVLAIGLADGFADTAWVIGTIVLAFVIPLMIAPVVSTMLGRMLVRLDNTTSELRRLATTDGLTGLLNRRGFDEAYASLPHAPGNHSVLSVDIDNFKSLNDTRGHSTGDCALKIVGDWLVEVAGPDALVARLGGDEFVVVAPVEDLQPVPSTVGLMVDDLAFTASAGQSLWQAGETLEEAVARSDEAMYAIKHLSPTV